MAAFIGKDVKKLKAKGGKWKYLSVCCLQCHSPSVLSFSRKRKCSIFPHLSHLIGVSLCGIWYVLVKWFAFLL